LTEVNTRCKVVEQHDKKISALVIRRTLVTGLLWAKCHQALSSQKV